MRNINDLRTQASFIVTMLTIGWTAFLTVSLMASDVINRGGPLAAVWAATAIALFALTVVKDAKRRDLKRLAAALESGNAADIRFARLVSPD